MARIITAIAVLLVLLLVLLFTLLNSEPVTINYYFGEVPAPLALVLILTLIAGALMGLLSSILVILSSRREIAKLRRQVRDTEEELMNLRKLPIKDSH